MNARSTFLDVSVVKHNQVLNESINTEKRTIINGTEQGLIAALGKVSADLKIEGLLIPHNFHVVKADFPIQVDGIIVMFKISKAILLCNGLQMNSISLPARSEVIRLVFFTTPMSSKY